VELKQVEAAIKQNYDLGFNRTSVELKLLKPAKSNEPRGVALIEPVWN